MITAIVLAAGVSRRMQDRNKLLLPFRGRPLIEHVVRTVRVSAAGEVIVVLGHEADRVREALAACDVQFTHNDRYREGMTSSIQAGLRAASGDAAGFMICLSDLPLIEPDELNTLIDAFEQARHTDLQPIVAPVFEGRRGHPVLFAAFYKPDLLAHDEPEGCRNIIMHYQKHLVEVTMPSDHVLRDMDTPDAYARLAAS